MEIWLDLEQTIISIFDDPVIVNKEVVKKFLEENNTKYVNIFSFAIWSNGDRAHFEKYMKSWLEDVFEVEIREVPTLEEIIKKVFWKNGVVFTLGEFCSIWGKEKAFKDYIRIIRNDGEFALVDDVVETSTFSRHKANQVIKFFNVDEL